MKLDTSDKTTVVSKDARARPAITTAFSSYKPPSDVVPMIRRMLDSVPEKYLSGLAEVVLTDTGSMPRSRRRSVTRSRGKKVRIRQARGLYHPKFKNRAAWIEIFVDQTLKPWGDKWWSGWLRDIEMSDVLFHEIGHHIHYTVRPEYREKEDVADVWKVRLRKNYQRQQYPRLRLLIRYLGLAGLFRRMARYADRRLFANGYISRAEYEESARGRNREKASAES
ncbi:MAG TPA: hypothetical protein VKB38_15405 [Terracidiphilus sp.]|nr:hypothetical protein [Terracidiphilus sp.]